MIHAAWLSAKAAATARVIAWENEEISPVTFWIGSTDTCLGMRDRDVMKRSRTPAQWFCLIGGAILLARGLIGFAFLDASFELPGEGWHHLIHAISGAILLAGSAAAAPARLLAIGFGLAYMALALAGIADGNDSFGLIAADAPDKVFHVAIGLVSLGTGVGSASRIETEPALP